MRVLRVLNNVSIVLHSAGITALCVAVLAKAPSHQPASFVFGRFHDGTASPGEGEAGEGWSVRASAVYVALCGALLSQYTLTGFDASAHLSEETRRASWSAPIGVVSSVGFSSLFGFFVQFSLATLVLGLAAVASALPQGQNANRPVPSGNCCVPNTNLKQDACTAANGQAGRCVPGGNNC